MKDGIIYDQRDIVLIPFPYSDLTGSKQRPALVISNKELNITEDRICCLITSKISKEGIEIKKNSLETGNLPFRSFIKPHRLFTISNKIIKRKLCKINQSFHNKIITNINEYIK
tara:strand:+ start:3708 stop:4049 length:342 start_codon:yes stop_codon:yes gene_type:complete